VIKDKFKKEPKWQRRWKTVIEQIGILRVGEIAVGTSPSNRGLKIKVLSDWKPSKGEAITVPFTVLSGGNGTRGKIYEEFVGRTFRNGEEFLKEARRRDPKISHPINANMMVKEESESVGSTQGEVEMDRRESDDIPSQAYLEGVVKRLQQHSRANDENIRKAVEQEFYKDKGKAAPPNWWERTLAAVFEPS